MNVPRNLTAGDVTRVLKTDGYVLKRTRGSHHVYSHTDGRVVVVPYTRLSDTFPIGTLRQIISAVPWTEDDLRRLKLIG